MLEAILRYDLMRSATETKAELFTKIKEMVEGMKFDEPEED